MTTQTKPFETYFGGKAGSGTYQTIINQIPPHEVYVEPFVGNGAIWRHKAQVRISLLNDVDTTVVDGWVKAKMRECNQIDRVDSGSQIFNRDAINFLTEFKEWIDRFNTFIYVGPPYPLISRKSGNRYDHELTDDDHRRLLKTLNDYRYANIAISTYPNEIYGEFLELNGWRRIEFESITRGGMATEWLFMNYDEPETLHDYSYVGKDYRERERIAKKIRRHVAKFNALPIMERNALLAALINKHH